ncbi:PHD finger protein 20-like isoform X1 [Phthorimaea operculella]|nr:PHD finger protein 20-like isoform X1 [Phthorimaea operculella]
MLRRSQRFLHDQDRLYEGLLPGAKPCETLRRSHELSGNLHRIEDALHALRVKYIVATNKNHPKLYLWASDWEHSELALTQEKLNSDYSDLSIMISSVGKENLPVKCAPDTHTPSSEPATPDSGGKENLPVKCAPDTHTPSSEPATPDRYSHKDSALGSQALLSGLLSSPGAASLDLPNLPITTTELEKLAKTVEAEQAAQRVIIPQPEAAIENSACRERLLRHIQRCQALIDARLDSVEAQVAELESQDPSFEDDETADYFPRTKQTIQMLMRDLDTMEELGVIT